MWSRLAIPTGLLAGVAAAALLLVAVLTFAPEPVPSPTPPPTLAPVTPAPSLVPETPVPSPSQVPVGGEAWLVPVSRAS
jgi:hypothetical protein